MKLQARLIYKSHFTCFQTSLPVYFYGMTNGKVVILLASNKTDFAYDTSVKWILAEHIDFQYDFESRKIFTADDDEISINEFMLFADNLEQRINVLATFGNFSSNDDAQKYFNLNVLNMLMVQNHKKYEMDYY
jgi:hypothetical protein